MSTFSHSIGPPTTTTASWSSTPPGLFGKPSTPTPTNGCLLFGDAATPPPPLARFLSLRRQLRRIRDTQSRGEAMYNVGITLDQAGQELVDSRDYYDTAMGKADIAAIEDQLLAFNQT